MKQKREYRNKFTQIWKIDFDKVTGYFNGEMGLEHPDIHFKKLIIIFTCKKKLTQNGS